MSGRAGLVESPAAGYPPSVSPAASPSRVRASDQSVGHWSELVQRQEASTSRAAALVRELRSKYATERKELATSVDDQVREIRVENLQLQNRQSENARQVQHLLERLNVLDSSVDGFHLPDVATGATEKLNLLQDEMKSCSEETELLKIALLDDQSRREASERTFAVEDEQLKHRMTLLEEQNEFLRSELHRLRMLNAQPTDTAIRVLTEISQSDAPSAYQKSSVSDMQREVLRDLERLREEHATLRGQVSSAEAFCDSTEAKRREEVDRLNETVTALSAANTREENMSRPGTIKKTLASGLTYKVTPPPAAPVQPAGGADSRSLSTRQAVADFYTIYNPSRLGHIDSILKEYEGAESELYSALEAQYGAFGYFSMNLL